ncbi:5587_t:CDS:2 [Funneliformis geosporum]|uniref:5587_t:CDS:1 n=1 Tax=Funneliformis geosporum TaxID=1117311 RepID=A0A9W4WM81_9GLOM|nr:5587_t:CDS:2 [Funneliformis geosporum]
MSDIQEIHNYLFDQVINFKQPGRISVPDDYMDYMVETTWVEDFYLFSCPTIAL